MTTQAFRSISALALLSLIGCTAGPFITNIEPLGNGKVRITEGRVGLFGVASEKTYELNLMAGTPVTGTVSHIGAGGNLITIALDESGAGLKSGDRFAIYSGKGYKGEVTVSEIDKGGKFCFGRVTLTKAKIEPGDRASTDL